MDMGQIQLQSYKKAVRPLLGCKDFDHFNGHQVVIITKHKNELGASGLMLLYPCN